MTKTKVKGKHDVNEKNIFSVIIKPSRCKQTTYFLLEVGCFYFIPMRKGQFNYTV